MKSIYIILIGFLFTQCGSTASEQSEHDSEPLATEAESATEAENTASAQATETKPADALFDVKAGKITFVYSGKWTGTETAWFDQYGKRCVLEQDIQQSAKNHFRGRKTWTGSKEGSLNCKYEEYGMTLNECQPSIIRIKETELSLLAHGDTIQLSYGYDRVGKKTIAGKEADGWKSKSGPNTGYVWKGIDLEMDNLGVIRTATSVEEIDAIPEELFAVPDGCKMK